METLIIVVLLIILLAIWIVSTQRKLAVMDENINNAMSQVGIHLSSRFDVLISLLDLAERCAADGSQSLISEAEAQRSVITVKSTPEEAMRQERIISKILGRIVTMAESCPELKEDKDYVRYLDAAECYGRMAHISCLIYNDSVATFNRSIQNVPNRLVAGLLGFHQRGYLETLVQNGPQ